MSPPPPPPPILSFFLFGGGIAQSPLGLNGVENEPQESRGWLHVLLESSVEYLGAKTAAEWKRARAGQRAQRFLRESENNRLASTTNLHFFRIFFFFFHAKDIPVKQRTINRRRNV